MIGENESAGELHDRLMFLGADLIYKTYLKVVNDTHMTIPQSDYSLEVLKPAYKIFKPDCEINFRQPVELVHNFCRGLSPYPTSWCKLKNEESGEIRTYK